MSSLSPTISQSFSYYFQDFLQRVENISSDLIRRRVLEQPLFLWHQHRQSCRPSHRQSELLHRHTACRNRLCTGSPRRVQHRGAPAKAEILQQLRNVIELVINTLAAQNEEDWSAGYQAIGVDDVHDRFSIFLRCAVHFHHHIGQMGYTKDEILRQRI